jgi:excisionase family DNA binding protein
MPTRRKRAPAPIRKASPDSALVPIPQAAEILDCSRRTVYNRIDAGDLEAVHNGRAARITRKSLEAFIARGGTRGIRTAGRGAVVTARASRPRAGK